MILLDKILNKKMVELDKKDIDVYEDRQLSIRLEEIDYGAFDNKWKNYYCYICRISADCKNILHYYTIYTRRNNGWYNIFW